MNEGKDANILLLENRTATLLRLFGPGHPPSLFVLAFQTAVEVLEYLSNQVPSSYWEGLIIRCLSDAVMP